MKDKDVGVILRWFDQKWRKLIGEGTGDKVTFFKIDAMFHFLMIQEQLYSLQTQKMNRRNWTQDEDNALKLAVEIIGNDDWTKISNHLRSNCQISNVAKRTGKQCRERWFNHLDPNVSKEPWTDEEEIILFKIHKTQGNKWKEISKYLPGRTDNDIKNRFYSTLRRSLRRLNKYIGEKNSTSHMREIRPSVLTIIINFIYENQNNQNDEILTSLKELPELIFKFSSFKPIKNNMQEKINIQMKEKINIILSLVDQFNQLYGERKNKNKQLKEVQAKEEENGQPQKLYKISEMAPMIALNKKPKTNENQQKKHQTACNLEDSNQVKIEEEDLHYGPILNAFDENLNESFYSIEEPSVSVNENLMGLIVIGKHIEPVEAANQTVLLENANLDQILYQHH